MLVSATPIRPCFHPCRAQLGRLGALISLLALFPAIAVADTREPESLADQRLTRIVERERLLLERAAAHPESETVVVRLQEIADLYQGFVDDNPDHLLGWIFYGRFLNQIGRPDAALPVLARADEIDSRIAVVKQQLAAAFIDLGRFREAFPLFLEAIAIQPEEPVYLHQLGQFLHTYRDALVGDGAFDHRQIDRQMLEAFRQAAALEPENRDRQIRYAEAYDDLDEPRWEEALEHWSELERTAVSTREREAIYLFQARIHIRLGQWEEAEKLLGAISNPALFPTRDRLRERIDLSRRTEN